MSDPLFWDLGLIVVQEAAVMTVLCLAGFYLIRGLFQGLNYLSNAAKPQRLAARAAALDAALLETTTPYAENMQPAPAEQSTQFTSRIAAPLAQQCPARVGLVESCH